MNQNKTPSKKRKEFEEEKKEKIESTPTKKKKDESNVYETVKEMKKVNESNMEEPKFHSTSESEFVPQSVDFSFNFKMIDEKLSEKKEKVERKK